MRSLSLILIGIQIHIVAAALPDRAQSAALKLPPDAPRFGYVAEVAFPGFKVTDPLAIVSAPGETNRLFIVEQAGRVIVVTNLASPTRTVFLDVSGKILGGIPTDERGLLGLAFHPGYATNRAFFIYYTGNHTTTAGSGMHDKLVRYLASPDNPNVALASSEQVLIAQRDEAGNHNAGDLHFGPDGYLYFSVGDEGGGNDQFNNSQRIDKDFFSGIFRIDVDGRPGSLPPNPHASVVGTYFVPPDNPFVGATNFNGQAVSPNRVRTELFAVGLRNPWRYTFDPATGEIYCADVGQNRQEEIDLIVKGGNYGWAYREGALAGPKTAPAGFSAIPPIQVYNHGSATNQGNSVTGGVVYRGERLGQLKGAYVFADYVSGNIWALRREGTNTTPFQFLARSTGISAFGIDPRNGDVLMANQNLDTLQRLTYSTNLSGAPFPATLAETGAFSDVASLTPAAGIFPYDVNVPFWSDHARKRRWFALPNTNAMIGFQPEGNWSLPTGMVWVKHFELELTNGVPESARRLETRFIVRTTNGVYGLTYRWDDAQTNATLVPDAGLDESFLVHDNGIVRTQVWHYPSRADCLSCHTPAGGHALGFNTAQLNREFDYGNGPQNQIAALSQAGFFDQPVTNVHALRVLARADDASYSREYRVRSYLQANCAQCHQPGAVGVGLFDARIVTGTDAAGLINGPVQVDGGDPENRVLKPGAAEQSTLWTRISSLGADRMPPLDSTVLDQPAIDLLRAWVVDELPKRQTFSDWQIQWFGSTNAPTAAAEADPDTDGNSNLLEFLAGGNPVSADGAWKLSIQTAGSQAELNFPRIANRGFEVQATANLFDPGSWQPLTVPDNRPFFFAVTNSAARIHDAMTNSAAKFYRVKIAAP